MATNPYPSNPVLEIQAKLLTDLLALATLVLSFVSFGQYLGKRISKFPECLFPACHSIWQFRLQIYNSSQNHLKTMVNTLSSQRTLLCLRSSSLPGLETTCCKIIATWFRRLLWLCMISCSLHACNLTLWIEISHSNENSGALTSFGCYQLIS